MKEMKELLVDSLAREVDAASPNELVISHADHGVKLLACSFADDLKSTIRRSGWSCTGEALSMRIHIRVRRPASHFRKRDKVPKRGVPATYETILTPSISAVCAEVMKACTGIVFAHEKQISSCEVSRVYDERQCRSGARVVVTREGVTVHFLL